MESGLTEYCTVCRKGAGKRGLESGEWLNRVLHSLQEGCRKAKVGESARRAPPPPPPTHTHTPRSSCSRRTAYTTCDCECFSKCSSLLKQQAHLAETSAYHVPFSVQGVDLSSTKITQKPARPKGSPPPPPPPISENLRRCWSHAKTSTYNNSPFIKIVFANATIILTL